MAFYCYGDCHGDGGDVDEVGDGYGGEWGNGNDRDDRAYWNGDGDDVDEVGDGFGGEWSEGGDGDEVHLNNIFI